MNWNISNEEIGKRLTELRKKKGFSQEELAAMVGVSRPSLAQIELGNRKMSVQELMQFAFHLQFSADSFLSDQFKSDEIAEDFRLKNEAGEKEERISVPEFMINKFRNVLLYVLEKCAAKANVGETVLYKLLYFSDFNYYEIYEEHLSGARYIKLPYGPVPQRISEIIDEMIQSGDLQRLKTDYHGFVQTRYIPLQKPDLKELKASETGVIDKVINQLSDMSTTDISAYSHNDMPWKATKDGDIMDFELAFYREKPYAQRTYKEEE